MYIYIRCIILYIRTATTNLILQDIAGFSGQILVAVKTLSTRDPVMVDKFVQEAELMKIFSHPNIVSLLGTKIWLIIIIIIIFTLLP